MKKVRVEVRLEKEFDNMLNLLMVYNGVNKSDMIRTLINDKYQELNKQVGAIGIKTLSKLVDERLYIR